MTAELDKSDFEDWMKNPITQELFKIFEENIEEIKSRIDGFDVITDSYLAQRMAYHTGGLRVYQTLNDLSFDQMFITEEEKSDEETPYSW